MRLARNSKAGGGADSSSSVKCDDGCVAAPGSTQAALRQRAGVPVGQIPDYVWPDCSRSLEATNETSSMHHHSMARLLRNNIDIESDSSRKTDPSERAAQCARRARRVAETARAL